MACRDHSAPQSAPLRRPAADRARRAPRLPAVTLGPKNIMMLSKRYQVLRSRVRSQNVSPRAGRLLSPNANQSTTLTLVIIRRRTRVRRRTSRSAPGALLLGGVLLRLRDAHPGRLAVMVAVPRNTSGVNANLSAVDTSIAGVCSVFVSSSVSVAS